MQEDRQRNRAMTMSSQVKPEPVEPPTFSHFERALIHKVDFMCEALIVVQKRLLWCAWGAGVFIALSVLAILFSAPLRR